MTAKIDLLVVVSNGESNLTQELLAQLFSCDDINSTDRTSEIKFEAIGTNLVEQAATVLADNKISAHFYAENSNDPEVNDYQIRIFEKNGVFVQNLVTQYDLDQLNTYKDALTQAESLEDLEQMKNWLKERIEQLS